MANRPVLRPYEVSKCHDQDCPRKFLLLSTLPMMVPGARKSGQLAQKSNLYQKSTNEPG